MSNGWLIAQRLLEDDPPVNPDDLSAPNPDDINPADKIDPDAYFKSTFASVQIHSSPDSDYFFRLNQRLGELTKVKVDNNTYFIKNPDGSISVRFWNTDIIVVKPNGEATINTVGKGADKFYGATHTWGHQGEQKSWKTVATRERLNQFLPHGWRLYGRHEPGGSHTDWNWYWIGDRKEMGEWGAENILIPFTDGDRILANSDLIPQKPPQREKLKRRRV